MVQSSEDHAHTVTTVLVIDDEPIFRLGVRGVLEAFAHEVTIVGQLICAEEAVAAVQALPPDVILFDLRVPWRRGVSSPAWEHGVRAIGEINRGAPTTRILVLSSIDDDPDIMFAALGAGAHGYIAKSDRFDGEQLVDAMRRVRAGETIYGPLVAQRIREYYQRESDPDELIEPLTAREREVLNLLIQRKSNREIADQLVITVKTVKSHVSNILAKYQIHRREEIYWLKRQRGRDDSSP